MGWLLARPGFFEMDHGFARFGSGCCGGVIGGVGAADFCGVVSVVVMDECK